MSTGPGNTLESGDVGPDRDSQALVSVVIPTRNSGRTLEVCMNAIERQSSDATLETIVVDTLSHDGTLEIARRHGAKTIQTRLRLLGARHLGLENSSGEFVLMLDADQVLEKDAIAKCLESSRRFDMICLEERSYSTVSPVEKLFDMDRQLIHLSYERHLDPWTGALLPRFFRRDILGRAFDAIPQVLTSFVVAHDHAIVYVEAYKVSKKVGLVRDAVYHIEPRGFQEIWTKNFEYGRSARRLIRSGHYVGLHRRKVRQRIGAGAPFRLRLASLTLLCLKSLPYWTGYVRG